MSLIEIIVLGLIQGLTEFLPVSSSAHLILPSYLLGWADQGLAFDIAVHTGTLLAVLGYFYKDIQQLFLAGIAPLRGRACTADTKLAWSLLLASLPIALAGYLLHDFIATWARNPWIIATTTITFGLLLWRADQQQGSRTLTDLRWRDALLIGCAQVLALVPGTSRSGITITAALFLNFTRHQAARYSFLLAIPAIIMATGYESFTLLGQGVEHVDWLTLGFGAMIAFICALACIHFFLQWITRIGMLPFVIYRLLLGVVLFVFLMYP